MTKIPVWRDLLLTMQGVVKSYFFLHRSERWSKSKMERYQFKKLKKLLVTSAEGVPYYKRLFAEIGFDPKTDFNSLKDIEKVPVLTKEIARANRTDLINPKYAKGYITMRTSGSSGMPFEEMVSFDAWVIEQAVVWRHWSWGGYRFRDQLAMVRSYVPPENGPLYKTDKVRNFTYYSPFHLNDTHIASYLEAMIEKKTTILRGYPSSMAALADYVLRTGCEIPPIKLILTASEVLTDNERKLIETAFRSKIFNHYGLAEVCVMMGDCEKHEGLHNYDEYGYLELHKTSEPNVSRIIGTNLHNLTMPLIRYDTGDLAEATTKPCSCGRVFGTVKNVIGRKDNCIRTPEGYEIPTVNFYTMFEIYQDIHQWQIVQHALSEIEFIIHADTFLQDQREQLQKDIAKRLPVSVSVKISFNDPFVKVFEGKQNRFISKVARS